MTPGPSPPGKALSPRHCSCRQAKISTEPINWGTHTHTWVSFPSVPWLVACPGSGKAWLEAAMPTSAGSGTRAAAADDGRPHPCTQPRPFPPGGPGVLGDPSFSKGAGDGPASAGRWRGKAPGSTPGRTCRGRRPQGSHGEKMEGGGCFGGRGDDPAPAARRIQKWTPRAGPQQPPPPPARPRPRSRSRPPPRTHPRPAEGQPSAGGLRGEARQPHRSPAAALHLRRGPPGPASAPQ